MAGGLPWWVWVVLALGGHDGSEDTNVMGATKRFSNHHAAEVAFP